MKWSKEAQVFVQVSHAFLRSSIKVSGRTQWPRYFCAAQAACWPLRPLVYASMNHHEWFAKLTTNYSWVNIITEDSAKLTVSLMWEGSHQGLPMHFSQGDDDFCLAPMWPAHLSKLWGFFTMQCTEIEWTLFTQQVMRNTWFSENTDMGLVANFV